MQKISEFQTIINDLIAAQNFHKTPERLYEPIAYVMSQGGKRLRPLLTLLACDLFDGNCEEAKYPALAVEVFHNFTLVHDDIMDKAPLRRGSETVYKKWNADIAILSGDTMFAMAYQYAVKTRPHLIPGVLETFSQAAIEVCEGQQLDMDFETSNDVSIDDYLHMITLKTAVLLGASLKIGALVADANPIAVNEIYTLGIKLGIAFQLQDDLLDVYGEEKVFGKQQGGDIIANKKTYLYLKALELANTEQADELRALYQDTTMEAAEKVKKVVALFDTLGIRQETHRMMTHFFNESLEHLENTAANPQKREGLRQFAQQLYERNR